MSAFVDLLSDDTTEPGVLHNQTPNPMAPSILLTPAVVALATIVYAIGRSFYNIYLHPLAKVPGPRHYAATDIFYHRHSIGGTWHNVLLDLHKKYGPIVRYMPNSVSTIGPESWKIIYGHKTDATRVFHKDKLLYGETVSGTPNIITADNENHKRMRRTIAHAFSDKALRAQEHILKHYTDLFISKMAEKATTGEAINIVAWYNYATFDLIGDLAFGKPFGCLDSSAYDPWIAMIFNNIRRIPFAQILQLHPSLKPFAELLISKSMKQSHIEHARLSRETALQRVQSGNTDREDFMSHILRNNGGKGQGLSEDEIAENAAIFITAGSETTATQLSGTTFQLLNNREKYDILVREIRNTFASEDEINISSVNKLEYLIAVFTESFRMYPPVPTGLPRVVPEGGETIDGCFIAGATNVSIPQWAAYQSDLNFYEPQRFLPERWLSSARMPTSCFVNDRTEVLQPFSTGPRNCVGKNLAYAEMRLIMARLLYSFDLELLPRSSSWAADQKVFVLWDKGDLMVKLKPRSAASKSVASA
ncbi:aspirochlorine biosynthesis cytochrome P450 monooxygenase [Microdochium nivale]|nr:aspirochlorine biosynthesis cytochrome P450 monooxygenase [Microdochium nivale]